MELRSYRKKPVVIEAVRVPDWTADCDADTLDSFVQEVLEISAWCEGESYCFTPPAGMPKGIHIKTLDGTMVASPGDWIIRGVQGEFYPRKPEIFEATYEEADA